MKLFKNFTTKKELKAKVKDLEKQIDYLKHQVKFSQIMNITTLRYDIETLKCSKIISKPEHLKFVEEQIAIDLAKELQPYINFKSEIDKHFSDEDVVKVIGEIKVVKER